MQEKTQKLLQPKLCYHAKLAGLEAPFDGQAQKLEPSIACQAQAVQGQAASCGRSFLLANLRF